MLVVITVVAIIAGVVITNFDSVSHDQLLGTAQVVAADIAHARNLAVTNNSSYKITFDPAGNRYVLTHSGINNALDVLPDSAFHAASGATQHITNLSSLPLVYSCANLAVVESSDPMLATIPERVLDVEFGPLGETTRASRTTIWLSAGTGKERKFMGIAVDPITGLASIGTLQTTVPESLAMEYFYEDAGTKIPPTYTDPTYTDPTYTDPTYTDPTYTDPTYTDPTYTDPTTSELDPAAMP